MKNRKWIKQLGEFVLDKGFYIALFLCVTAIGISGYYLYRNWNVDPTHTAAGSAQVQLPDASQPDREPQPDASRVPDPAPTPHRPGGQDAIPADPLPQQPPQEQQIQPDKVEPRPAPVPAAWVWPVEGEVLRPFSVETLSLDPTLEDWRTHAGTDVLAPEGAPVLAAGGGTVTEVYEDGLMGTTVVIDHGKGLTSLYASLAPETLVEPGDSVQPGTPIGAVGTSAMAEQAMQPHLHLEVWNNGLAEDPLQHLPEA